MKPGEKMPVSIKGREPEGYYKLFHLKVEQRKDWSSREEAFADRFLGRRSACVCTRVA